MSVSRWKSLTPSYLSLCLTSILRYRDWHWPLVICMFNVRFTVTVIDSSLFNANFTGSAIDFLLFLCFTSDLQWLSLTPSYLSLCLTPILLGLPLTPCYFYVYRQIYKNSLLFVCLTSDLGDCHWLPVACLSTCLTPVLQGLPMTACYFYVYRQIYKDCHWLLVICMFNVRFTVTVTDSLLHVLLLV